MTDTTIAITGPKVQVAQDASGQWIATAISPEELVTRTMTFDTPTVLNFIARMCDISNYTLTIPNPAYVANSPTDLTTTPPTNPPTIPNPEDCAIPAMQATINYWLNEAQYKAKQIVAEQKKEADAAAVAAQLGTGLKGYT